MGIIKRMYSPDFYTWPIDKEKKHASILRWDSIQGQPIVVFHPHLSFDPLNNLRRHEGILARDGDVFDWQNDNLYNDLNGIYDHREDNLVPIVHEEIEVDVSVFNNLDSFLSKIADYFKLESDQWLWYDTGFWAAKGHKYGYIGISEESAIRLWNENQKINLCYIASNTSMLLEFYLDKRVKSCFSLNVYYTNRSIVFPDLIDCVHRALDNIGYWKTINIENKDHDVIFSIDNKDKQSIGNNDERYLYIKPKMVMPFGDDPYPGTDFLYAVVVENTFFNVENVKGKPEGYAILTRPGGWLKEDFQGEKKYMEYFYIRKLAHCYLVNMAVEEI